MPKASKCTEATGVWATDSSAPANLAKRATFISFGVHSSEARNPPVLVFHLLLELTNIAEHNHRVELVGEVIVGDRGQKPVPLQDQRPRSEWPLVYYFSLS